MLVGGLEFRVSTVAARISVGVFSHEEAGPASWAAVECHHGFAVNSLILFPECTLCHDAINPLLLRMYGLSNLFASSIFW
jgi:hypothetical protein